MKTQAQIAALVRERSPLSPDETERLLRTSFAPARAVHFLCRHYAADRLAVLDIGCGYGQHLVHFGPGSIGLDVIERNVEFVRALGLSAVLGNVEDGFPQFEQPFDAVFASNLLEHLVAPHLFLLRLHQLLKPDGLAFIHVPTIPPLPLLDRVVRRAIGHNGYRASEHIYAFTPRVGEFLLQRAGFIVVDSAFVAVRDHPILKWGEPLFREIGISVMLVGRRDPAFRYPEKRVQTFTPTFMASLDSRAGAIT
jgi:SAM-dependent methyltransferase